MFKGSNVALVTPFKNDKLDDETYIKLIHFHIENGTNGLVPAGTTGESPTLSHDEHERVIDLCVKESNGKLPVFAGTGSNSTEEAISLTTHAEKMGADGALIVTPYYNKPSQEGLYLHHKAIAEAVDLPNILYNVPGRTAVDMLPETTSRLADIPNIIGIKDATGQLSRGLELLKICGDKIAVYSGDDATAIEFLLQGGMGNVSVTANVAPQAMSRLCALAMSASTQEQQLEVRRLNDSLMPLNNDLFVEANPIPVKWALSSMGLIGLGIRLPLTPLAELYHQRIEAALEVAGIHSVAHASN